MNLQQISKVLIFGMIFLGIASTASAATSVVQGCALISRNLTVGVSGDDVKLLQQVLNRNKETQLAESGPGSPGNETMYFGLVTKAAVARFQEIYKNEVLSPAGLTSGSGYVGTFTRAKMIALCNKPVVPPVSSTSSHSTTSTSSSLTQTSAPATTPTQSTPTIEASLPSSGSLASVSGFYSATPVLTFPSSYTGPVGDVISIAGIGLASSGNVVHLDGYTIASTTTGTDGSVSFVVPKGIPLGKHDLWISSSKGNTNKTFFIITDTNVAPPVVVDFTPKEGFYGTVVTVTGTGFLPQGNSIDISYGRIDNISSADGKTLQFTVAPSDITGLSVGEDRPDIDVRDPQGFYVMNKNGISEGSVFFLKI